jgi:hypothetical protein
MVSFNVNTALKAPFGKNVYLRSTQGLKFESYTLAAATWPAQTIDGVAGYKCAQPGTALAKITSGPDAGKVGPYQAAGTAEVQTLTASGTVSGGTYTLTFNGQVTSAIAYNASAATVQAALEALSNVVPGDVVVGGGPFPATPLTFTFYGNLIGDQPALSVQTGNLTGSTPGAAITTSTGGVAGAADGRQTAANLVGILDTFVPWQLVERDVEVAVMYEGTAIQSWCFELNAAGVLIPLANATALAMAPRSNATNGGKLDIKWS